MMLLKCCTQYASKFGKLSRGHRTGKGQFSFQTQRNAMPKNAQTTAQLHSFHRRARWISKFFKPGFNNTWTVNLDVQAGFRKGRGTRDQITNIRWILEKGNPKKIYLCFTDYTKAFDCVDHNKLENSSRDGNISPPDLPPEKSACRSRSNSWNRTWNNRLDQNWERSYVKAVYCHLAYLTYM